jgi:PRTRC genetic system protein C
MIELTTLSREFTYNGVKLPDPNPSMTLEEVRAVYTNQYPDLATAPITGPETSDGKLRYSFVRASRWNMNDHPRPLASTTVSAKRLRQKRESMRFCIWSQTTTSSGSSCSASLKRNGASISVEPVSFR